MKKYWPWLVVAILLIMNLSLLFKLKNLKNKNRQKNNSFKQVRKNISFPENKKIPLRLNILFPKEYCSRCIDFELPWLKKVAGKYPFAMKIINPGMKYDLNSMISNEKR